MALKIFDGRVWNEDKRVVVNRVVKDILIYGFFSLLIVLTVLLATGTLDGTKYFAMATFAVVVIRAVLKMFEKYDKTQKFQWFYENETTLIELGKKIWALLLALVGVIKKKKED